MAKLKKTTEMTKESANQLAKEFKLTIKQIEALKLLGGPQTNTMLFGGSRSGKTFVLVRAMCVRALKFNESRHAIVRQKYSHIRGSIMMDTFPKVMKICFPDVSFKINEKDSYCRFPNGSEIWFMGLDDKDRAEKILGREFATIYFNEASQISYGSVVKAFTRLAQKIKGLINRAYFDCNPPGKGHWSYKMFILNEEPQEGKRLPSKEYDSLLMNPMDNLENIDKGVIARLENLPEKDKKRFLLGMWSDGIAGAVYGDEFLVLERKNRITKVDFDKEVPVYTAWDIGIGDSTAIWFFQVVDGFIHIIDYYEKNAVGLPHYVKIMKERADKYGYKYDKCFFPHDGANKSWSTGRSRRETAIDLGLDVWILPKLGIDDGIHSCRMLFGIIKFDGINCKDGIEKVKTYRYEFDDSKSMYKEKPIHDYTSHAADAFRYLCMAYSEQLEKKFPLPTKQKMFGEVKLVEPLIMHLDNKPQTYNDVHFYQLYGFFPEK